MGAERSCRSSIAIIEDERVTTRTLQVDVGSGGQLLLVGLSVAHPDGDSSLSELSSVVATAASKQTTRRSNCEAPTPV